jgi:hypothetical protein
MLENSLLIIEKKRERNRCGRWVKREIFKLLGKAKF